MTAPMPSSILRTSPARPTDSRFRAPSAFTLLELLLVISIIAILASMLMPAVGTMTQRADSVTCAANLRAIGMATQLYLQDHSFIYPCIETDPTNEPVYPAGVTTQTMVQAFAPYGITAQTMQCPSDVKQGSSSSYAQYGTSYDWKPTLDDENGSNPLVYGRRMTFGAAVSGSAASLGIVVKLSKIRQVFDDTQIHFGHMNALYADGHVVYFSTH